jgi:hypothetical protein
MGIGKRCLLLLAINIDVKMDKNGKGTKDDDESYTDNAQEWLRITPKY